MNVSPEPIFKTDEQNVYFLAVLLKRVEEINDDKINEKLDDKLGVNEDKILSLINKDNNITIVDLSKRIGISTTAIENNTKKLKTRGLLERVEQTKVVIGGLKM